MIRTRPKERNYLLYDFSIERAGCLKRKKVDKPLLESPKKKREREKESEREREDSKSE